MGTKVRPRPTNLRHKLRQIRIDLGMSQTQMIRCLGFEESMHVGRISEYEQGTREPSLLMLLAYARLAGIHMEDIVDDDLDLPARLPGSVLYRRRRAQQLNAYGIEFDREQEEHRQSLQRRRRSDD